MGKPKDKIKAPVTKGIAKVPVVMQMEALEFGCTGSFVVCQAGNRKVVAVMLYILFICSAVPMTLMLFLLEKKPRMTIWSFF